MTCWHILDCVQKMGAEFDAVNVATALHRVAKQKPDSQAELAEILSSAGFRHLVLMVEVQVMPCCLWGLITCL